MIKSYCYDYEVLPNFLSLTLVDINSYLKIFEDACEITTKKGKEIKKPVPLVRKFTVEQIKERLNKVDKKVFYITDTDDKGFMSLISVLNSMRTYRDPKTNNVVNTHLFGYNSSKYDKLITAAILMNANHASSTKELIKKVYGISNHIINVQHNPEIARKDKVLQELKKYNTQSRDIDLMTVFGLNNVGMNMDEHGNEVIAFKSLKQVSINLQWFDLLEHTLPPIGEVDRKYYRDPQYKGMPLEQLNKAIGKWDRYILPEWIPQMLYYNCNDVLILCEMIRLYIDEVRLRYSISNSYKVDVLSSSRSGIADALFVKFYTEFSETQEEAWRGRRTLRDELPYREVILPQVSFKTKELNDLLNEMKSISLTTIGKKGLKEAASRYKSLKYLKTNINHGWFEITLNDTTYIIGTGGLHTKDKPGELRSKLNFIDSSTGKFNGSWDTLSEDSYIFVHQDISSFYPSLIASYDIAPQHLNQKSFVELVKWLRDTRVELKHSKEEFTNGVKTDLAAQALKIVINSIFGKFGYYYGDTYDLMATLKVTINGQLLILMLCEELELNGIKVISANTDGIVTKLYKKDKERCDEIVSEWSKKTKMQIDSEEYDCYINRDISSYIARELNGKVTYKGSMNPMQYSTDLQKGYDMPVVAQAVSNFFLEGKSITKSLYECNNILDFCKTQNVGRQFDVIYSQGNLTIPMQKNVRYYVSNNGGQLCKMHKATGKMANLCVGNKITILNTLDDKDISLRNINYGYYYNECIKIIDPIKLMISSNMPPDKNKMTVSGKKQIRTYSGMWNKLFNDDDY